MNTESTKKNKHNWLYVSLLLSLCLLYTVAVGFNILASFGAQKPLFKSNVGNVSDTYSIEVTPAGWVFSIIWTIIFIWQYLWLIYAFICLFRQTEKGEPIYRAVKFIHFGILIAFAVNNAVIIAWLFLWDNFIFGWALLMIAISVISLQVCLFISFYQGYKLKEDMYELGLKKDVWINRFLIQNGLGFFCTWLSLATNLNFAIFLTYDASVNVSISSTIVLFIILVLVLIYFVLENFVWQRYLMYMFTPWFVLNLALIGSVVKNFNSSSPTRNNIISVILLAIIILCTLIKIIMFILYHTKLKHRIDHFVFRKSSVSNSNKI